MQFLPFVSFLAGLVGAADNFRFIGRVNPETRELTWPGTGVAFNFTGSSASIALTKVSGTNSVDLIIDDAAPIVISNVAGSSISTPANLTKGTHSVVLLKRSEATYGSFVIGDVTAGWNGSVVATSGKKRQIEIIGDSITVGYGLDGTAPCVNTAALENNPLTYAAIASSALNAEYHVIAWSGKGITRNYADGSVDTSPIMPELYVKYGALDQGETYTFPSTWTPDVFVVNLGTNDFSYVGYDANGTMYGIRPVLNATTYADAMTRFVMGLQSPYPQAHFFFMTSPMLGDYWPTVADAQKSTQTAALKNVVAAIGEKAHLVEWPTQGSVTGCDSHPNAATRAEGAKILKDAVSKVMGW